MFEQRRREDGCQDCGLNPKPHRINKSDVGGAGVPAEGRCKWAQYDILDFGNYDFTRSQIVRDERGWCLIVRDRYGCWAHVAGPFRLRREARDKLRRVIGRQMECEAEIEWWEAELAVAGPDSPLGRHDGEEPTPVLTRHLRWRPELDMIRQMSTRSQPFSTLAYKYRSDCGCYVVGESETGEWVVRFRGVPLIGARSKEEAMNRGDDHRGWLERIDFLEKAGDLPRRVELPATEYGEAAELPESGDTFLGVVASVQ